MMKTFLVAVPLLSLLPFISQKKLIINKIFLVGITDGFYSLFDLDYINRPIFRKILFFIYLKIHKSFL